MASTSASNSAFSKRLGLGSGAGSPIGAEPRLWKREKVL